MNRMVEAVAFAAAGHSVTPVVLGNRAAEVARRVHERNTRHIQRPPHAEIAEVHGTFGADDPATGAAIATTNLAIAIAPLRLPSHRIGICEDHNAPDSIDPVPLNHVFGVKNTACGVLFVQPADAIKSICVAGDFNGWSPTTTPLRPNRHLVVQPINNF